MSRRVALLGEPFASDEGKTVAVWYTAAVVRTKRIELFPVRLTPATYRRLVALAKRHPLNRWSFDVDALPMRPAAPGAWWAHAITSIAPAKTLGKRLRATLATMRTLDLALLTGNVRAASPTATSSRPDLTDIADSASRLAARAISTIDVPGSQDFQAVYAAHTLAMVADYFRIVRANRARAATVPA